MEGFHRAAVEAAWRFRTAADSSGNAARPGRGYDAGVSCQPAGESDTAISNLFPGGRGDLCRVNSVALRARVFSRVAACRARKRMRWGLSVTPSAP